MSSCCRTMQRFSWICAKQAQRRPMIWDIEIDSLRRCQPFCVKAARLPLVADVLEN